MAVFKDEHNLCKKSVKVSEKTCISLVNEVDLFTGSSTISQALKNATQHCLIATSSGRICYWKSAQLFHFFFLKKCRIQHI